jgi:hypothetical protein
VGEDGASCTVAAITTTANCGDRGITTPFPHVRSSNERASALYRSLGFVEEGRKTRRVKIGPNEYLDDLRQRKPVRSQAATLPSVTGLLRLPRFPMLGDRSEIFRCLLGPS